MNKKDFVPNLRSFLPAHGILIAVGLLLVFLVSACGPATPTPSSESVIYEVKTVVAETLTAQVIPSPTPTASATATPTASPTSYLTLTTATPTPTSQTWYWTSSTSETCNSSELVKDMTIPDGTILAPGETFIKTWKFENTGSCAWEDDYLIVFVKGDDMDGDATYLDTTVAVDKKGDASVFLTAPDEEGTYYGYWQLANENGYTFGEMATVEIVVSEDVTSTPTASATPMPTATPISTIVETATETPTPTPTCTPVPTEVSTEEPTEVPTEEPTEEQIVEPVGTVSVFSLIGWFF